MRCRHKRALASSWIDGGWFANYKPLPGRRMDRIVCLDCAEWLPLGPSNDAGESVAIEYHAARIASKWAPLDGEIHAVADGWQWSKDGHLPEMRSPVSLHMWRLAGFLAREIVNHDATHDQRRDEGSE